MSSSPRERTSMEWRCALKRPTIALCPVLNSSRLHTNSIFRPALSLNAKMEVHPISTGGELGPLFFFLVFLFHFLFRLLTPSRNPYPVSSSALNWRMRSSLLVYFLLTSPYFPNFIIPPFISQLLMFCFCIGYYY